jgi:hypothetical protein
MAGQAKRAFDKTLGRVDGLLALHPHLHGSRGRPRRHVSDILRGALVLGLAALDSLVVDSVVEAVPTLARKGSLGRAAAKWIKEEPDSFLACFAQNDPAAALASLYRDQLGSKTFQRADAIAGVLRDVIDCDPPWEDAAIALSDVMVGEWTADNVRESLDEYVDRRNRIVHGGDLKPGGTAAMGITFRYVDVGIEVVKAVGNATSAAVHKRVRSA